MDPTSLTLLGFGVTAGGILLQKILGPSLDAVGGIIGAPLIARKEVRLARLRAGLEKAAGYVKDSGEEPQEVPDRVLMPLLEKMSLEDDAELQDQWARLLAAAAVDSEGVPPVFVSILGELSVTDAKILNLVARLPPTAHKNPDRDDDALAKTVGISERAFEISKGNLVRLGLVDPPTPETVIVTEAAVEQMYLSAMGRHFLETVTRKPEAP